MVVAQSPLPHVAELDGALAAAVHEKVALNGVKLCSGDHFLELLHVCRLDIHDV